MYEPGSFDVHKNATVPIIVILGHSELDVEISDIGMESMESDNYREMSRNDGDTNSVLAMI